MEFDQIRSEFSDPALVDKAEDHLNFLQRMHSQGISWSRPSTKSLQRYTDLWLPMVHTMGDEALIPPQDIAWLWHCHRLAPYRYTSYLFAKFGAGVILEAHPPFSCQLAPKTKKKKKKSKKKKDDVGTHLDPKREQEELRTRALWQDLYPAEDFFLSEHLPKHGVLDSSASPKEQWLQGFDLLASTSRQATFLWQVSGPRFQDKDFRKYGLVQYYKFLLLKHQQNPTAKQQIIVPTYQIDLLWHTHILSNLKEYYSDCKKILGSTLHHDDSLNDRAEGGRLDVAFRATVELWKTRYGEDYQVPGGMYRGEPPSHYFCQDWRPDQDFHATTGFASTPIVGAGPFLQMINVQGATSTNPSLDVIWCWKESSGRISNHPISSFVGDPGEGWVAYDALASSSLESVYQSHGNRGTCSALDGYVVDMSTMKQRKLSTGFERDVQRVVRSTPGVIDTNAIAVQIDNQDTPALVATPTSRAPSQNYIWCWRETHSQMGVHPASSIAGNPHDGWIRYDGTAAAILESAYQSQNQMGTTTPLPGYEVDFGTMKQRKLATNFLRDVCRMIDPGSPAATIQAPNPNRVTAWTDVYGNSPSGARGYVAASDKSKIKGVNANTFRDGYIFGKESRGLGYYHNTTKEAYQILYQRVKKKVLAEQQSLNCAITCLTLFTCGQGSKTSDIDRREKKLSDLQLEQEIIAARANARAPLGVLGIPSAQIRDPQTTRKYYSDTGDWYFPATFYLAGGGCGASYTTIGGGGAGGGCGAAACGAAACGGGGWGGGGGCGGGGCGGGGGGCGGGGGG